jgi:uncharacterized protein YjdB
MQGLGMRLFCFVALIATYIGASAHNFEIDGIFYNYRDKTAKTVEVTYSSTGEKYTGNVVIPETVTYENVTYTVAAIGSNSFSRCSGLIGVVMPNTVVTIKQNAFEESRNLTGNLVIPNSVTFIGEKAFCGCSGLMGDLIIPDSVVKIGARAFLDCSGFDGRIVIPSSVKEIGVSAFRGCTRLTGTLDIPNSITTIEETTFANCNSITTINIPSSIVKIGKQAFADCIRLTEVNYEAKNCVFDGYSEPVFGGCSKFAVLNIGDGIEKIPDYSFAQCKNLTVINMPNSVKEIGNYAFELCENLRFVALPNSVKVIGSCAFMWCKNLERVEFCNSLETIGECAFYGCTVLRSITLPKMLKTIGKQAFYKSSLSDIVILGTTPSSLNDSFENYNATVYVPAEKYAAYYVNKGWGQFNTIKKLEVVATDLSFKDKALTLTKWDSTQLVATAMPTNVSVDAYFWYSENPAVVTVDQNGMINAVGPGKTVITAKTIDGSNLSAQCEVTVLNSSTEITLSQTELSMAVNELVDLSYNITPSFIGVKWSSSNIVVADFKVNADNSITIGGLADGVATITATATDGSGASASCVVTVGTGGIDGVEADKATIEVARYDLYGRKLCQPARGVNIIKMSDGSIRKEMVK